MKRILFFVLAISLVACSSDDSKPINNYEVLSYSYEVGETTDVGYRMKFTATVKNNSNEAVTGKVRFTVQYGTGMAYNYIHDVSIDPGETKTASGIDGLFNSQTITITNAAFVPNED